MSKPLRHAHRVVLSAHELEHATRVGVRRQIENLYSNATPAHGAPVGKMAWGMAVSGAIGEAVVAKAFNVWWCGSAKGEEDVPGIGEVKAVDKFEHRLLIQVPKADREKRYILVAGVGPHYWIQGWIHGENAVREEYIKELRPGWPSYCVPLNCLLPIRDFPVDED